MLSRGSEELPLAPKAAETLRVFLESGGAIISKNDLMNTIWSDAIVDDSNLAQYVHQLRKTLGNQKNGRPYIETLRRRGYRFNAEVTLSTNSGSSTLLSHSSNIVGAAAIPQTDRRASKTSRNLVITFTVLAGIAMFAFIFFQLGSSMSARTGLEPRELTIKALTEGEDASAATIAPNGSYFTYATVSGGMTHLWSQQTGQSARIEVTEPLAGSIIGTSFSPDSQFIYFVGTEKPDGVTTLFRVPVFGGERVTILNDIATPPSFSPDGKQMTFVRLIRDTNHTSVMVADSDGGDQHMLLPDTDDRDWFVRNSAWSPDGRVIAFGSIDIKSSRAGSYSVLATEIATGTTKELSNESWDNCYRLAWTSDGRSLIFIGTKSKESQSTRDQIYTLSIADRTSRRLTTGGSRYQPMSLGITTHGEVVGVPFDRISQIWSMDANGDSRTATQLTSGRTDGRGGILPMSDGRIAYLTRSGDGYSIWVMDQNGSGRHMVASEPPNMEELRGTANGSFFVFASRNSINVHLYRVDIDGTNLKQLTNGESGDVDSSISPDGKWIAYSSASFENNKTKFSLMKIPSDGGDPTTVSPVEGQTPHFSPDGSLLSLISTDERTISIIRWSDGKLISSFPADQSAVLNIGARWTPDGKAVAYIAAANGSQNIIVQPLDGSPARTLTDLKGGNIHNFAFSADGKSLYLARGYETHNVVLIENAD